MRKQLPDGRYRVSVLCPDGVRRTRTVSNEGAAKLLKVCFEKGWFNGVARKRGGTSKGNWASQVAAAWRRLCQAWWKRLARE